MAILTTYPKAADPFKEGSHDSLSFSYGVGRVREGSLVTDVAADSLALTDDAISFISVDPLSGIVSANTTAYPTAEIPLYRVLTAGGQITSVEDDRCFFGAVSSGSGQGISIFEEMPPLETLQEGQMFIII